MKTKSWKDIKDDVYGKKGTERRDQLERDTESFKIGLLLRQARESKNLTQQQLAEIVEKKRTYISRVENNGSNLTLKTLYDIVEKGLGGTVKIVIDV
jgi:DNA-binding XRE family transcriptional regulator